ncbi:MAG: hypothetical protein B6244_08190 [Candidatus Cloacimonetes bacterium 4572_55]|nr:MAG: hypothetical protein B6244_08190 [Candidatus Cloacimonetes bacterium 4572_55]
MKKIEQSNNLKYFPDFKTLPEAVISSIEKFPDKIALQIKRGKSYDEFTYTRIKETIDRMCAALAGMGFAPGDHAAVIGENRPEWAISYLAIQFAGGVVIPIDARNFSYSI